MDRTGFNSRAHKGRDLLAFAASSMTLSFNSRAHKGRDALLLVISSFVSVSIHAPTRGATLTLTEDIAAAIVSIHAPTRGATRLFFMHRNTIPFQFTRPQGARQRTVIFTTLSFRFNSRAHKGRDSSATPRVTMC